MRNAIIITLAILILSACTSESGHQIDGPYRIEYSNPVSNPDQKDLVYRLPDGTENKRIGSYVFAAGANEKYVVAKNHPNGNPNLIDYYYLIRSQDSETADPADSVKGPFTKGEFDQLTQELDLPFYSIEMFSSTSVSIDIN